ncbi:MAG: hypothetical protein AAF602_25130 [Myxococcota bacterium]
MIRGLGFATAVVTMLGFTTGCGENCNATCFRAYDEGQCRVDTPGVQREQRINECIAECRSALRQVGPIGDYSPFASGGLQQVELENEVQAAAWMDCIAESECSQLQAGRCNPL